MSEPQRRGDASTGFDVDQAALRRSGQVVGRLAEELLGLRTTWTRGCSQSGDAFGYRDLQRDFRALNGAWSAEFDVYAEVLEQLHAGIAAAADRYEAGDQAAAVRLDGTVTGDREAR